MEERWSETWARLMDEMKLWLVGNRPEVNIVILIKWTKNANSNEVRGTVELYARDTYGQPYCRQRVVSQLSSISTFGDCIDQSNHHIDDLPSK